MSLMSEFKTFAVQGNVVDLAVGLVIGAAFTKIVSSLVANIITPPLGLLLGGVDFSNLAITLSGAAAGAEPVTIGYGVFLQAIFDFIIIAFAIFMVVKGINKLKRQEAEAPSDEPAPSTEEVLLTEIRDALRAQNNRQA